MDLKWQFSAESRILQSPMVCTLCRDVAATDGRFRIQIPWLEARAARVPFQAARRKSASTKLSPVQAANVPKPLRFAVDGALMASIRKMAIIMRKMAWLFLEGNVCSNGTIPLDLP